MAARRKVLSYFIPLILSAIFFGAFFALGYFRKTPLNFGAYGDIRVPLTNALHFLGWITLIIFVVRVIDAFIFDVVISRRRNVVAPQLLRQIFAITGEPLDDPALKPKFRSLLGAGAKPFECVGEVTECRAAVLLAARRDDRAGDELLQELAAEVASWPDAPSEAETAAMFRPVSRNFIPDRYR